MNNQEVFDVVVDNLRKQNKASVNEYDQCVYRGLGGTKCAAGFLIPDEIYQPWMDDRHEAFEKGLLLSFDHIILDRRVRKHLSHFVENIELILDLQDVHDNHEPNEWEDFWQEIANEHDLKYSPPTIHSELK